MNIEWNEIRTLTLVISLILTNGISVFFYLKNKNNAKEDRLNEKFFRLQDIAFTSPYLEDGRFINGWIKFKYEYEKATNIEYDYDNIMNKKYLQYEKYCEMLFNFLYETHCFYQDEKKILNFVRFDHWIKIHNIWWKNPLQERSNQETYDEKFCDLIDKWMA